MNSLDKVYSLDVDGNIAHLMTPVLLEQKQFDGTWKMIQIPTAHYDHNPIYNDQEQYRILDNNQEKAFMNARDFFSNHAHRGVRGLQEDVNLALLDKQYGYSFYRFVFDVLLEGRLFSFNTARGHVPENLKQSVRLVVDTVLTAKGKAYMAENIKARYGLSKDMTIEKAIWWYLDHNMYYPCSNYEVKKLLGIQAETSTSLVKTLMQDHYIQYIAHFQQQHDLVVPK